MRVSRVMTSRLVLTLATLAALNAHCGASSTRAVEITDRTMLADPSVEMTARIKSLIESWFSILEDPAAEAKTLGDLLERESFELLLDGKPLHNRSELREWLSNHRATFKRIEYRIDSIDIHPERMGRYRVRFEFDRHAFDEVGFAHVARREQTWIVQDDADETPVILSIEERQLLFFSGTGPQIICY